MKTSNVEMCSGPLLKNILRFAFPFMLMGLIQRLYNAADTVIVGRFASSEAMAGVGTTGSLATLMITLITGLSSGASVAVGRALGAKDEKAVKGTVHTALLLSLICGIVISVIGAVFAEPLLRLIDTPDDVMHYAKIYLQITFAGHTPSIIYSFAAAILRAKGDTKRPLYIAMVSGFINVILNLVFVICFKMSADGVAIATVISNAISMICALYILLHEEPGIRLEFKELKINKIHLAEIVRIGIPAGVQASIFSFSNVIIQSSVNSFGSVATAGNTAAANIGGFFYIALNTFFHAAVTFVSRNMGAKNYSRINKIVMSCIFCVTFVGVLIFAVAMLFGKGLLELYLPLPEDAEAVKLGMLRIMYGGAFYGLCGYMEVLIGVLRGMGHSFKGMVVSIIGVCGLRIAWVFTVFKIFRSLEVLYVSLPVSWIGTTVMLAVVYAYLWRSLMKKSANSNNIIGV